MLVLLKVVTEFKRRNRGGRTRRADRHLSVDRSAPLIGADLLHELDGLQLAPQVVRDEHVEQ